MVQGGGLPGGWGRRTPCGSWVSGTGEKLKSIVGLHSTLHEGQAAESGPQGHIHGWVLQAVQRDPGLSGLDPLYFSDTCYCRWRKLSQGSQISSWLMA